MTFDLKAATADIRAKAIRVSADQGPDAKFKPSDLLELAAIEQRYAERGAWFDEKVTRARAKLCETVNQRGDEPGATLLPDPDASAVHWGHITLLDK